MSTRFAWRIIIKVDETFVEGPAHIAVEPITDAVIDGEIKTIFKHVKLDVPADEVDILAFVAKTKDMEMAYYEPLDPYVFWPIPPEILGREYRDIVRDTKSCKKGGEN